MLTPITYLPESFAGSSHGVVGLTKVAALEYSRSEIRVNAVCPGTIDTPLLQPVWAGKPEAKAIFEGMEPIGRICKPEESAEVVVWLYSDAASFVTGHVLVADGGYVAR